MEHINQLENILQSQFSWHKSRVKFMSMFITALIKVRTVNLTQLALSLNPSAQSISSYRRLQRFFAFFELDFNAIARFVVSLLPSNLHFVLTLDRTNWKLGKVDINLLVLAISYKGIAFPVLWSFLPKRGNSNTLERIELLNRFIHLFGKKRIRCLTADREFIGDEWIAYLKKEQITFSIRVRANALANTRKGPRHIKTLFHHLKVNQYCSLSTPKRLYNQTVRIAALRLTDDFLILITNHLPEKALESYKQRWQIETLFGALKSRGFDFEATHLTHPERVNKLLALLSISFCWAHLIGEWRQQIKPIKIKKHQRRAISIFRYGLDYLREILLNISYRLDEFKQVVKLLSCT